jgi:hypothetical protein
MHLGKRKYLKISCEFNIGSETIVLHPFVNPGTSAAQLRREAAGRILKRIMAAKVPEGQNSSL